MLHFQLDVHKIGCIHVHVPSTYSVRRFLAPIAEVNRRLKEYAGEQDAVTFVDCTPWFVTDNPQVPLLAGT